MAKQLFENNGITTSRKRTPQPPSAGSREWVDMVDITPAMATYWLENYHFDGQRKIKPAQVKMLASEMRAGRFKRSEFRMGHVNGQVMLSNGQHRLHAVLESGITIPASVYNFIGDGRADVADDYTYCDINSLRTLAERVQSTDLLERTGMTYQNFNALCASLAPIIGGFTPSAYGSTLQVLRSAAVRQRAIEDYAGVANDYYDVIFGCDGYLGRTLRRKPIMAVGLITLGARPVKGTEFWKGTAENDGLRKGDPRHTLMRWLLSNDARTTPPMIQSRVVATAWNAFYEERTIHRFNLGDTSRPIKMLGAAHYDGTKVHLPYGEVA